MGGGKEGTLNDAVPQLLYGKGVTIEIGAGGFGCKPCGCGGWFWVLAIVAMYGATSGRLLTQLQHS